MPGDAPGTFSALYGYAVIPSAQGGTNDAGLHGSMVTMPHLAELAWDYADRLQFTSKSAGSGQLTYFTYDASGQRVRKVYEHSGIVEERIYLGGYEVYRRHAGSVTAPVQLERRTLHVMDDARRVAMVETKTVDTIAADATPIGQPRWRYQLDNHIGSSALELDQAANVISYEEYHPYGSTAFLTASGTVSQKRYRYTGKEKDNETGLYYHGARYYAAWLGRWTAADPKLRLNAYVYVLNNPLRFDDPNGAEESSVATRLWGGVRALGGALQVLGGAVVFAQIEVPVAAQVAGGVAIAHGASDWEAGWRQVVSGRNERSAVEHLATGAASLVTKDEKKAEAFGTAADLTLGFVNPAGPAAGGPRLGMALATTGHVVPVVVETTPRLATAVQGVRAASATSHGATAVHMMSNSGDKGGSGEGTKSPESTVKESETRHGSEAPEQSQKALPPKRSATETRQAAGNATGSGTTGRTDLLFRGTHGSVAQIPEQLASKLRGKTYTSFDEFRETFWKAVAADPNLASGFSKANLARLQQGLAPIAPAAQQYGALKSYILHHKTPIEQGGAVYDLGNLEVVSPRYHQMLHYGK